MVLFRTPAGRNIGLRAARAPPKSTAYFEYDVFYRVI
jgi:hypothetical protein